MCHPLYLKSLPESAAWWLPGNRHSKQCRAGWLTVLMKKMLIKNVLLSNINICPEDLHCSRNFLIFFFPWLKTGARIFRGKLVIFLTFYFHFWIKTIFWLQRQTFFLSFVAKNIPCTINSLFPYPPLPNFLWKIVIFQLACKERFTQDVYTPARKRGNLADLYKYLYGLLRSFLSALQSWLHLTSQSPALR